MVHLKMGFSPGFLEFPNLESIMFRSGSMFNLGSVYIFFVLIRRSFLFLPANGYLAITGEAVEDYTFDLCLCC